MTIQNQSFLAYVDFFSEDQFQVIGEYGDRKLLLIGRAKAYREPIVAISESDKPNQENLIAYDLYELMKFGCHRVTLTSEIWSNDESKLLS
jgi:hypothetical protein